MLPRLGLLQALSLAMMGAVFPFLALELQSMGVTGLALTAAMVATPALRLVLGPGWGMLADRFQASRWVLLLATGLALAGCLALLGLPPAWALLGVLALGIGRTGTGPLVDGLTLRALVREQDYGKVRLWGSVGFLVAAFSAGVGRDYGLSPLWIGAAAGAAMIAVAWSIPQGPKPQHKHTPMGPALRALGRDRTFVLLLLASALHFGGHAVYDSYFSVHIQAQGADSVWTGLAVTLGVGVEIGVLAMGPWLLQRFGARRLLMSAMLLAIPRWVLTALAGSLVLEVGLQSLHGVTFGAFWIAAVALVSERAPAQLRTSGLGLLSAAVGGVGAGIGNLGGALIIDSGRDTHLLFVLSAVLACLASLVAWRCVKDRAPPAAA